MINFLYLWKALKIYKTGLQLFGLLIVKDD